MKLSAVIINIATISTLVGCLNLGASLAQADPGPSRKRVCANKAAPPTSISASINLSPLASLDAAMKQTNLILWREAWSKIETLALAGNHPALHRIAQHARDHHQPPGGLQVNERLRLAFVNYVRIQEPTTLLDSGVVLMRWYPTHTREGLAWIIQAAESPSAEAQYVLSQMYVNGDIVPSQPEAAARWADALVLTDRPRGLSRRGELEKQGLGYVQNPAGAFRQFQEAAASGFPEAMLQLAAAYITGKGTEQNVSLGMDWLRKSARSGYNPARLAYGREVLNGRYLIRDQTKAISVFQAAAQSGAAEGHYQIALCYHQGTGVPADLHLALKHHEFAAALQHPSSTLWLSCVFLEGCKEPIIKRDTMRGMHYLHQAEQLNLADAKLRLGRYYYLGVNVDQDYQRSRQLLQQAAEMGSPEAALQLSEILTENRGLEPDIPEALHWLSLPHLKKHPQANYRLALLHRLSHHPSLNLQASLDAFVRAAQLHHPLARLAVDDFYVERLRGFSFVMDCPHLRLAEVRQLGSVARTLGQTTLRLLGEQDPSEPVTSSNLQSESLPPTLHCSNCRSTLLNRTTFYILFERISPIATWGKPVERCLRCIPSSVEATPNQAAAEIHLELPQLEAEAAGASQPLPFLSMSPPQIGSIEADSEYLQNDLVVPSFGSSPNAQEDSERECQNES